MMIKNNIQNSITFTGKERDEEKEGSRGPFASERGNEPRSGIPNGSTYLYTYFGARYMDHELMTMWLSVDPMADKYPGISPYAYCAWNSVKLVDPEGMDIWKVNGDGELIWQEASDIDKIVANDGSYVEVMEGVLTRGESIHKSQSSLFLDFDNNIDNATEVFEFMADHCNVEFSLIGISDPADVLAAGLDLQSSPFEYKDFQSAKAMY